MEPTPKPVGHGGPALCGSRLRQSEGRCRKTAGWGTAHVGFGSCRLHGGNTRNQAVAADRERVEVQARRALADLGAEPVTDPLSMLMRLAGEAVAFAEATGQLVNELPEIRYVSRAGTEQLRAEVGLYERATVRVVHILVAIIRLGVEDQLVRIEEKKAAVLMAAVEAALAEIGIAGPDAAAAKRVLARHLRALPAAPGPEVA